MTDPHVWSEGESISNYLITRILSRRQLVSWKLSNKIVWSMWSEVRKLWGLQELGLEYTHAARVVTKEAAYL